MPDYSQITGSDNIRHSYRPIGGDAYAQYVSLAPAAPLGHHQLTVSNTAVGLPSIPLEARRVIIRSLGAPINFRDDGTDPTPVDGFPILADEILLYDTTPDANFKMIRDASATQDADVRLAYYG